MNQETVILIIQAAVKYGPAFAQSLVEIFHTQNPTPEQWKAAFAKAHKTYDEYVKAMPTGVVLQHDLAGSPLNK